MIDYSKIQQASATSSNKLWRSGTGSMTCAALAPGSTETFVQSLIPHGLGSRDLLYQFSANITPSGGATTRVILPWAPGDNRQITFAAHDAINLTIYFISTDSSGLGEGSFQIDYVWRILIP